MVPNSIKIPVPFEYVFPNGALFLSVDKLVDFDRLREDDNQARDEHGVRLWVVKVMDAGGTVLRRQRAELKCGDFPLDFLLRTDRAVYKAGDTMTLTALGGGAEPVFVDLLKDGQTLLT